MHLTGEYRPIAAVVKRKREKVEGPLGEPGMLAEVCRAVNYSYILYKRYLLMDVSVLLGLESHPI